MEERRNVLRLFCWICIYLDMKNLCFFIIVVICACNNPNKIKSPTKRMPITILTDNIKRRKTAVDSIWEKGKGGSVLVFAKIKGNRTLVIVRDKKWPDNIEYSYNVLKNSSGKIVSISSSPVSESGDWDVECLHYFNLEGKIIAYEKRAGAFVLPDDGIAYETITDYFDTKFKLIKTDYELIDKDKKNLDKQYAFDYGGVDTKVYSTVTECLKAYNIKL